MSVQSLSTYIKQNLGTAITDEVKAELAREGLEQYSFKRYYLLEWCEWIVHRVIGGSNVPDRYSRSMVAEFYKTLKKEIRNSGAPYHFKQFSEGVVVTQLQRRMAGFQKQGSSAQKIIRKAKRSAIDKLSKISGVDISSGRRTSLMSDLHGHHGGVKAPGVDIAKTTGGALKVRKDLASMGAGQVDLDDLVDDINQTYPDQALYDVLITELSQWIDVELQFDRNPEQVFSKSRAGRNQQFQLFNLIKIEFALGSSTGDPAGREYTSAMSDWDAGNAGGLGNQIDAALLRIQRKIERFVINQIMDNPYDLVKLRGSPSVQDHLVKGVPASVLATIVLTTKGVLDKRLKINKKILNDYPQLKKASTKNIALAIRSSNQKLLKRKNISKTRPKKATPNSPLALRNTINKFLPQTLKSMMVAPRLVYRTGRFANSARVENIYQGSRGGYSADYTYMKNPYQTFEPGFNMGSTFRDPRSIISTAIRSIALEQMGIKFGQVRRT